MSQSNRLSTTASIVTRPPKEIHTLLKDPEITISNTPFGLPGGDKGYGQRINFTLYVKKAVDWKGRAPLMPNGVKTGLGKAIALSKAAMDTLGTAIDPATGYLVPRKGLRQRELRERVAPMLPEEVRRRRREYRAPGVTPYPALGITVPAV